MLKICLCSDNHGDMITMQKILNDNPACDYYLHLGDSMVSDKELEPFISVLGNCDYYDFPKYRILNIANHSIMMIHGNGYVNYIDEFIDLAKSKNVDTVFFGHTHAFNDSIIDDIRFINPGSTSRSRDGLGNCYAIVTIDDNNEISVERINIK